MASQVPVSKKSHIVLTHETFSNYVLSFLSLAANDICAIRAAIIPRDLPLSHDNWTIGDRLDAVDGLG